MEEFFDYSVGVSYGFELFKVNRGVGVFVVGSKVFSVDVVEDVRVLGYDLEELGGGRRGGILGGE